MLLRNTDLNMYSLPSNLLYRFCRNNSICSSSKIGFENRSSGLSTHSVVQGFHRNNTINIKTHYFHLSFFPPFASNFSPRLCRMFVQLTKLCQFLLVNFFCRCVFLLSYVDRVHFLEQNLASTA